MADSTDSDYNFKDIVIIGGLTILVLALLPLLAVAGIFAQFAFVVVAPVVLAGTLAYALVTRAEPIIALVHGIKLPNDLFFGRAHTWARKAARRCVVAGVDDFAQRLLGPVDAVETVPVGTRVRVGDLLATLRRGDRELPVYSPTAGVVTKHNPVLTRDPQALNGSPYGRGWLVELDPVTRPFAGLRRGSHALAWMRAEVDRLLNIMQPEPALVSLPDGGELVPDVSTSLDDDTWQRVVDEFFAPRPTSELE